MARSLFAVSLLCLSHDAVAFTTPFPSHRTAVIRSSGFHDGTALCMAGMQEEEELKRQSKWLRSANVDDRLVELKRPLGLVLKEDEDTGNVYVETVAPGGFAARTGQVKEGDVVVMCSATFGEQMWSTRGVGLSRVLNAIRVRAGPTVKLVFESPADGRKRAKMSKTAAKTAQESRIQAQQKKDRLLAELEQDEKKLRKGKFLGLF